MRVVSDWWTHCLLKLPTTSFNYNLEVQAHIERTIINNLYGLQGENTFKKMFIL